MDDDKWLVLFYSDRRGREPVREWLERLKRTAPTEFGVVSHQIDLLEEFGPILSEPHTKQLRGKLRELRRGAGACPISWIRCDASCC